MDRRDRVVIVERLEKGHTGYGGLSGEIEYLRKEDRQLHQENEKLREIFRIAGERI